MAYVTRWRMHVAVTALAHDGATAAELAHRLGYRSEAAFSRAFKRVIGVPPGSVKRSPILRLVEDGRITSARGPAGSSSSWSQPARVSSPEPSTCCISAGSPW
jgi:AraC-like DNA-binding protein